MIPASSAPGILLSAALLAFGSWVLLNYEQEWPAKLLLWLSIAMGVFACTVGMGLLEKKKGGSA